MPKVTIWIREEDYPKWKTIENRPDWLHSYINLYEESMKTTVKRVEINGKDVSFKVTSTGTIEIYTKNENISDIH